MSDESSYLSSLERRITANETMLMNIEREKGELRRHLDSLDERLNKGASPTANRAELACAELRTKVGDLDHKVDISMSEMKRTVIETTEFTRSMVANFKKADLDPIAKEMEWIKTTFVYGLIGAAIVFAGDKTFNAVWNHFFNKPVVGVTEPSVPVKGKKGR